MESAFFTFLKQQLTKQSPTHDYWLSLATAGRGGDGSGSKMLTECILDALPDLGSSSSLPNQATFASVSVAHQNLKDT